MGHVDTLFVKFYTSTSSVVGLSGNAEIYDGWGWAARLTKVPGIVPDENDALSKVHRHVLAANVAGNAEVSVLLAPGITSDLSGSLSGGNAVTTGLLREYTSRIVLTKPDPFGLPEVYGDGTKRTSDTQFVFSGRPTRPDTTQQNSPPVLAGEPTDGLLFIRVVTTLFQNNSSGIPSDAAWLAPNKANSKIDWKIEPAIENAVTLKLPYEITSSNADIVPVSITQDPANWNNTKQQNVLAFNKLPEHNTSFGNRVLTM